MSATNTVTNPAVSNSGEVDSLLIEKFLGKLKENQVNTENLMRFFDVQEVVGTDMVSEKFMGGNPQVIALAPGQDPEAGVAQYEKSALRVDTMLLTRYAVAQFHEIQSDLDGHKSKLAKKQGDELKRIEDSMLVQQLIYGARTNTAAARSNKPRVDGQGFSQDLQISDTQAEDPNSVIAAVEKVVEDMIVPTEFSDGIDPAGMYLMVDWPTFNIMRDAERITNGDYVDYQGETVSGFVLKSYNIPVMPTRRMPRMGQTTDTAGKVILNGGQILSNASNGNRYTADTEQTQTIAILFNEDALLVGNTMQLAGDIFFDKRSKSYLIDAWLSEGAIPSNWESVGIVRKGAASDNADVTKRAKRKAKPTRTVS